MSDDRPISTVPWVRNLDGTWDPRVFVEIRAFHDWLDRKSQLTWGDPHPPVAQD